jgi:hypothetical protein
VEICGEDSQHGGVGTSTVLTVQRRGNRSVRSSGCKGGDCLIESLQENSNFRERAAGFLSGTTCCGQPVELPLALLDTMTEDIPTEMFPGHT